MILDAIYACVSQAELHRIIERAEPIDRFPLNAALRDGRALELGRAWEELGCLLEGGIRAPADGPAVGDHALGSTADGAVWSYSDAARVRTFARELTAITREMFMRMYRADDSLDTAEGLPGERTGEWGDRAEYLWEKLQRLGSHYERAAKRDEAVIVRIAPRRSDQFRPSERPR